MFENERPRKIEGGGGGRCLERKGTSLWLVNQISKELKTPGLFHARIIAPVCNPVQPSSTPVHPPSLLSFFSKEEGGRKESCSSFPPRSWHIFIFFRSLPLPFLAPFAAISRPRQENGRQARVLLSEKCTHLSSCASYVHIDDHTSTRAQFPLLVGESISEDLENA